MKKILSITALRFTQFSLSKRFTPSGFMLLLALSSSLMAYTCSAQYKDLLDFNGTNGELPGGNLTSLGTKLFGMASKGGPNEEGTIFSIDSTGKNYKIVTGFYGWNGLNPVGSLSVSYYSELYGMAYSGGTNNAGLIFSVDTNGNRFRVLHEFSTSTGSLPMYGSLLLVDSMVYGMTASGGKYGKGCVFSIDTTGRKYSVVHNFIDSTGTAPRGSLIRVGIQFYGMTYSGGKKGYGVVFRMDTNGKNYRPIWTFDTGGTNGANPEGSLIFFNEKLYGMTSKGGSHHDGNVFCIDTNGSGYKELLAFNGNNGVEPFGSLVVYKNNTLCGMTLAGGANGSGVIFTVNTDGSGYNKLYSFQTATGGGPIGDLTLFGQTFFGMTYSGGANGYGVIFRLKEIGLGVGMIQESSLQSTVYPNPSNGKFTLQSLALNAAETSIQFYNVLGEKVYSASLPQTPVRTGTGGPKGALSEINLSSQPNGVYFYRLIATDGEVIGTGKVVIDK